MADSKITALTSIGTSTDPVLDQMVIVDVSDGSMAGTGTTKKVSLNQLLSSNPSATGGLTLSGALAAGSATITGDLTVDTSTLKVDSANNRVGIGVAVTGFGSTLTVSGDIEIVGGNKTLFNSAGFLQIGTSTANYLALQTNSTERYRIASDGVATWSNVGGVAGTAMTLNSTGLGVGDAPVANTRLTLGSVNPTGLNLAFKTTGVTTGRVQTYLGNTSGDLLSGIEGSTAGQTLTGSAAYSGFIGTFTNNPFYLVSNGLIRATIDSSGNVGIGVTPSALLHVQKSQNSETTAIINNTNTGTSAGVRLDLQSNSSNYLTLQSFGQNYSGNAFGIAAAKLNVVSENSATAFSSGLAIGTTSSNPLYFATSNAVKMTLDASGNLLVGKTATGVGTVGNEIKAVGEFYSTQSASTNANFTYHVYSTGAAAYRFYVGLGGTVYATNTTISAISDARLKENVQDIDVGLDAILALKPRKFDWKNGKGKNIKGDRGFIAQEFETVFPNLVDEWKDPAPEGEAPYKSVRQDLIPVLVKAIQQLTDRVITLENK